MMVVLLGLAGCPPAGEPAGQPAVAPAPPTPADGASAGTTLDRPTPPRPAARSLRQRLGRCVVAEGHLVESARGGVELWHPAFRVEVIAADDRRQEPLVDGRVRVEGLVAERSDGPVVADAVEPGEQDTPPSKATEHHEANRRLVIESATIVRRRSYAEVEPALAAQVGEVVSLPGILWRLNGRYWFDYDGVDLRLEGLGHVPDFGPGKQGRLTEIRGRLGRKVMPRIHPIVTRTEPDRVEVYYVAEPKLEPHPAWPLRSCGSGPDS